MPALKRSYDFKKFKRDQGNMRTDARLKLTRKQLEEHPPKKTKFTALTEFST